ncbi:MAG TPA: hypothetical protein VG672_23965 [Bryobacteraceae bacterium]|nr:hypothetical protein [Bryobacteraceae bacterium]
MHDSSPARFFSRFACPRAGLCSATFLLMLGWTSAAPAQVLVQHEYDPVSDAVVSWRLEPGASAGQSFTIPRDGRIAAFRCKLQRDGDPGKLDYRLGRTPGGAELGSGSLEQTGVSPWFEHWREVRLPHPVAVHAGERLFLQLRLPRSSAGAYQIYGTASAALDRPEFRSRFQYSENWYNSSKPADAVFENTANLDYRLRTAQYPGGAAFDAQGRELAPLDFAFQILGEHAPPAEGEERFAFIEALTSPIHTRSRRPRSARPRPGEISLDGGWTIVNHATGPVVETAVGEFRTFLAVVMQAPVVAQASKTITVATACADAPRQSEAFALTVASGAIQICGYDDRGAMQGLHYLENRMLLRRAPFLPGGREQRAPAYSPRITSAPFYSKAELEAPIDQYTDGLLGRISRGGFNAIWVWGDLDEIAHSEVYPELDHDVARRQRSLNELIRRASRYGIDVYLQLASRPLPEEFYQRHPGVRGSRLPAYGGVNILCSSVPEVRRHLRSATRNLMTAVPGLKGVMFIVGGEGFMHCYTRRNTCPRCSRRPPSETIAEFSAAIFEGVRAGRPDAAVALWPYSASNTWSRDDTTQSRLIERLPAGMTLLTEFGKEGAISFGGITIPAYDYPITITGPSDRFVAQSALARQKGLGIWVKTEHAIALEFVQTPYIPVFFQWNERFHRLHECPGVSAVFANWMHYGFTPSRAADVFYWNIWRNSPESDLLSRLAARDFGESAAAPAVRAWQSFSQAIRQYPFSGAMAMGPVQAGPSHPLFFDPTYRPLHGAGRQFKNDLAWTKPWGPELAIAQFEKMEKLWAAGVADLEKAVAAADPDLRAEARRELGVAQALFACIRSTRNVARFYLLRDRLLATGDPAKARETLAELIAVAQAERANAVQVLPFIQADSRLGYANSGKNDQTGVARGGIYSAVSIQKKIAQVDRLLGQEIPAWRRTHHLE